MFVGAAASSALTPPGGFLLWASVSPSERWGGDELTVGLGRVSAPRAAFLTSLSAEPRAQRVVAGRWVHIPGPACGLASGDTAAPHCVLPLQPHGPRALGFGDVAHRAPLSPGRAEPETASRVPGTKVLVTQSHLVPRFWGENSTGWGWALGDQGPKHSSCPVLPPAPQPHSCTHPTPPVPRGRGSCRRGRGAGSSAPFHFHKAALGQTAPPPASQRRVECPPPQPGRGDLPCEQLPCVGGVGALAPRWPPLWASEDKSAAWSTSTSPQEFTSPGGLGWPRVPPLPLAQPPFLFNPPPSRALPPIPGLPGARLPPVPLSTPCPPSPGTRTSPGHTTEGLAVGEGTSRPWWGSSERCCGGDGGFSLLQSLCLSVGVPGLRRPHTLYPWHRMPAPGRVRRAWVIPPISVSENHKRLPFPLVQVRGRVL